MKRLRKLRRRSFLALVAGGGALAGGALFAVTAGSAQSGQPPRPRSPMTDGDKNPADVTGPRGCTDYDAGPNADPPTRGRGSGNTDRDPVSGRSRARPLGDRAGCGRPYRGEPR